MLSSDLSAAFRVSDSASRWVLPKPTFSSDLQRGKRIIPAGRQEIFQKHPLAGIQSKKPLCSSQGIQGKKEG